MNLHPFRIAATLAFGTALLAAPAVADEPAVHGAQHPHDVHAGHEAAPADAADEAFGRPGDPRKATRTIVLDMRDTMRFGPDTIRVRQGETIRLIARNKGKLMHEIVLGTMDGLKAHGKAMNKHPEMEHDEPHMAHVAPGRKGQLVWQFTKPGEFHYACLVPGHFEAGMVGKIVVVAG